MRKEERERDGRLRVLICQQQKLTNCTPDCDSGRDRINPATPAPTLLAHRLSLFLSSFSSSFLPLQTTVREGEGEGASAGEFLQLSKIIIGN